MTTHAAKKLHAAEMLRAPPSEPPPGWGTDDLSRFWDAARCNQFGTFVNKAIYRKLAAIDGLFVKVTKGWLNPEDEIAAMLLVRCHSAFRAAAGLAAAGQVAESFVMNRATLEYAAYALHLHCDAVEVTRDREQIWLASGENEYIPPSQLADYIMRLFLDLLGRANQGKVERPHL